MNNIQSIKAQLKLLKNSAKPYNKAEEIASLTQQLNAIRNNVVYVAYETKIVLKRGESITIR